MAAKLREALARWLAPELATKADRYEWLHREISAGYWWLGEFDEITAYTQWLLQHNHDAWRGIDEGPWLKWRWYGGIPQFRDQLRNLRDKGAKLADDMQGQALSLKPEDRS